MQCFLCRKEFASPEFVSGRLSCFFHPQEYSHSSTSDKRYGQYHYPCCGATKNREDWNHYEHQKVPGCYAIDHCSKEGFHDIVENGKPYFLLERQEAVRDFPIVKEKPLPWNVLIVSKDPRPKRTTITLSLPMGKKLKLSIDDLQNQLRKSVRDDLDDRLHAFRQEQALTLLDESKRNKDSVDALLQERQFTSLYENEEDLAMQKEVSILLDLNAKAESEAFIPMVIIQRVSSEPDDVRASLIKTSSLCFLQQKK
jgi:hypothetical protein